MLQNRLSSNEHGVVCQELVLGDLQVEGRRALASAPRGVVVAAVAGAEPAVEVSRIGQRHAACRTVRLISSNAGSGTLGPVQSSARQF